MFLGGGGFVWFGGLRRGVCRWCLCGWGGGWWGGRTNDGWHTPPTTTHALPSPFPPLPSNTNDPPSKKQPPQPLQSQQTALTRPQNNNNHPNNPSNHKLTHPGNRTPRSGGSGPPRPAPPARTAWRPGCWPGPCPAPPVWFVFFLGGGAERGVGSGGSAIGGMRGGGWIWFFVVVFGGMRGVGSVGLVF